MPTTDQVAFTKQTYAYAGDGRFERSLDFYAPKSLAKSGATTPPLVVLVVGSAWLGHSRLLYSGTAWWNASGPKTFAKLGIPCVSIRHRGAFPCPPPVALLFALLAAYYFVAPLAQQMISVCLVLGAVWHALAFGAASHDEMMDDVALALKWIRNNRERLVMCGDDADTPARPRLQIFGGYSSGAHVAMSLLQRPGKLAQNGLTAPMAGFDGVLLLSGVCSARGGMPLPAPKWATRIVSAITSVVFGSDAAEKLPSPVHTPQLTPAVPHLLIHCRHEGFGIRPLEAVLDVLLCSKQYAAALSERGLPVQVRPVDSDHWTVLNSGALSDALQEKLLKEAWPSGKM